MAYSEQHADQSAQVLKQQQAASASHHGLAKLISSSSHKLLGNWPGVLWQGTSAAAAAQPSAKSGRLACAQVAAKQNKSCASCSAVWRGQAEREQQQAKQLEQQLRETQGSTQTLEQQASLIPAQRVGGCENPAAICSMGQHLLAQLRVHHLLTAVLVLCLPSAERHRISGIEGDCLTCSRSGEGSQCCLGLAERCLAVLRCLPPQPCLPDMICAPVTDGLAACEAACNCQAVVPAASAVNA